MAKAEDKSCLSVVEVRFLIWNIPTYGVVKLNMTVHKLSFNFDEVESKETFFDFWQ